MTPAQRAVLVLMGMAATLLPVLLFPSYRLDLLALIAVYAVAAVAQNLLAGYADVPALGNVAFFAVGAYVEAALVSTAGLPSSTALVIGVAASGLAGLAVGLPALRISGMHLAIISVLLVFVSQELMTGWNQAHGVSGATVDSPGWLLAEPGLYLAALLMCAICYAGVWSLLRSRTGRAIRATADSSAAARASGIDPVAHRLAAFVVSGGLTGAAGAMYAYYAHTVTPGAFPLDLSLAFLTMMMVGGSNSLPGSLLGAFIIGLLPEALRVLPQDVAGIQIRQSTYAIYALLLLVTLRFLPDGIWNALSPALDRLQTRAGAK